MLDTRTPRQPLFEESQSFRQLWIWTIILIVCAVAWFAFVQQIIFTRPFGTKPAPDLVVWMILLVFGISLPLLFANLRMVTVVWPDRIEIRYRPLFRKTIYRHEIRTAYARRYHPIREYGGWGLRWSSWAGLAYNVFGNQGVHLEMANEKRILIGSQHPEELASTITFGIRQPGI